MNNEAIRLCVKFFTVVKKAEKDSKGKVKAPEKYKGVVMKSFEQLLNGGQTETELSFLMDKYVKEHKAPQDAYTMDDILAHYKVDAKKKEVVHDPDNLLENGRFYYHPQLQVAPPPPMIEILPDGTFKSSYEEEEFFLEIKDSYTLDDLVEYFYQRSGITKKKKDRDKAAFKHVLKSEALDVILYAIDEACVQPELPRSPFDIEDYLVTAELILDDRKNTCFDGGLDHVIPRPQ